MSTINSEKITAVVTHIENRYAALNFWKRAPQPLCNRCVKIVRAKGTKFRTPTNRELCDGLASERKRLAVRLRKVLAIAEKSGLRTPYMSRELFDLSQS